MHHSDQGSQYFLIRYTDRLIEAAAQSSVGSVGDSYDNALPDTINGLCKTELIRHEGPWRSVEAVELANLRWVHWYNSERLHEPLGYLCPDEFEAICYHAHVDQRMAA